MLEMLVVLAVLGLVYALALPALSGVLAGPRLDGEARHLVAAVREARATAIVGGREVRFLVTGRAWRFADRNGTVHEKLTLTLEAPSGGADRDGRPSIRFFAAGGSTGGRLTLSGEAGVRRVDVNWLTGRVTQSRR